MEMDNQPVQMPVAVDLMIVTVKEDGLCVMLSQRNGEPYEGAMALPGRLMRLEDSAEDTAGMLLEEMLPGADAFLEQLYTFTAPKRDPRGRVLSIAYLAVIPYGRLKRLLREGKTSMELYRVRGENLLLTGENGRSLPESELAFDHARIIRTGVTRLQGKLDYTDIGFYFLENRQLFTLGELQTVHESIMAKTMDVSNFRRAILARYEIAGRITQTDRVVKQSRGRPAALYRFEE